MTRIVNNGGRLAILRPDGIIDVERASGGRFSSDPQAVYEHWADFAEWAATTNTTDVDGPRPGSADTLSPVPRPRQAIAVGLNYRSYLEYAKLQTPTAPGIFVKLFTSLAGPNDDIVLPSDQVTGEVELVLVIGKRAWKVSADDALNHLAGVTVGQDLIDGASSVKIPTLDGKPGASYVNPAKSRPGFAPVGPEVVTLDEAGDLGDLRITLTINDELVQDGNTNDAVFSVPELIAKLSDKVPLLPGDIVFTGSPGRVAGAGKAPFRPGDVLVASVGALGVQRHVTVADPTAVSTTQQEGQLV